MNTDKHPPPDKDAAAAAVPARIDPEDGVEVREPVEKVDAEAVAEGGAEGKAKAVEPEDEASRGIARLFDLRGDLDDPDEIDAAVRTGAGVAGTNLWVLFFAVLVASVGLNVNSTAVIIGAMLMSPLMGPIIGIGYGLAVRDLALSRRGLRNLLVLTVIGLVTSTLYFNLSPLREMGSELAARTSPTLWDVLIAFFGGSAGIIALTRRSISNVIPGMAIATALMPPLCTVGFGVAHGDWASAGGALYLYVINSVFIAVAAFLFVKLIRLPRRGAVSKETRARTNLATALTVLAVLLPSGYLAWRFVEEQRFIMTARELLDKLDGDKRYVVIERRIDPALRRIALTVSGPAPNDELALDLGRQMAAAGFVGTRVLPQFSGGAAVDVEGLKSELLRSLRSDGAAPDFEQLLRELRAQLPHAAEIAVGFGSAQAGGAPTKAAVLVDIVAAASADASEQERIENWLTVRLPGHLVRLSYSRK